MSDFNSERRNFLKLSSTIAGSSLVLGINWSCSSEHPESHINTDLFVPNAWLKISDKNEISVIVAESEMGQGPYTLMPMMVAEELEVDWDVIQVERAPADPIYGYQMTGGSSSIRKGWNVLRQAGAVARQILVNAAADKWAVAPEQCVARLGAVEEISSGRQLSYGELVAHTEKIEIPDSVELKEPEAFSIIGKPVSRKDIPQKINGSAEFGIDVSPPGLLYATVVHCPVLGGRVKQVDKKLAMAIKGAVDAFEINEGMALVAKDIWTAFKMAKAISIEWTEANSSVLSTETLLSDIKEYQPGNPTSEYVSGNVKSAMNGSMPVLSRQYLQPFHAHMTMEPMNCTAWFRDNGNLEIWAPTQSPSEAYNVARALTQNKLERGVKKIGYKLFGGYDESIVINTTLLGGGFGRRLQQDYVSEAVQVAEHFTDPVQVVWTREEDVQHDFYHPMTHHKLNATLNDDGYPLTWDHNIRGGEVNDYGARHDYQIPNQRIRVFDSGKKIPTGPWRSVAPHYNVFAVEHFLDELASKAGIDPVQYRLKLLSENPRLMHVIEKAADGISWLKSKVGNKSYGVAAAQTFGSYVAQTLELEKTGMSSFRVNKVVCAIDCGIVINPDIVKQQMEGSIIFGLSAATKSKITIKDGRVEQSNFHDYPILRMYETPEIEVIIVNSSEDPEGIGEPGVPPIAPALANAFMAQTGKPVKNLPLKLTK